MKPVAWDHVTPPAAAPRGRRGATGDESTTTIMMIDLLRMQSREIVSRGAATASPVQAARAGGNGQHPPLSSAPKRHSLTVCERRHPEQENELHHLRLQIQIRQMHISKMFFPRRDKCISRKCFFRDATITAKAIYIAGRPTNWVAWARDERSTSGKFAVQFRATAPSPTGSSSSSLLPPPLLLLRSTLARLLPRWNL